MSKFPVSPIVLEQVRIMGQRIRLARLRRGWSGALGLDRTLEAVADPDADLHGKALEMAKRPLRACKPRLSKDAYDF